MLLFSGSAEIPCVLTSIDGKIHQAVVQPLREQEVETLAIASSQLLRGRREQQHKALSTSVTNVLLPLDNKTSPYILEYANQTQTP